MKTTHIEPFLIPAGSVSPGGQAAIALRLDGNVVAVCIGSGDIPRDAKACALRNVRALLQRLKRLAVDETEHE